MWDNEPDIVRGAAYPRLRLNVGPDRRVLGPGPLENRGPSNPLLARSNAAPCLRTTGALGKLRHLVDVISTQRASFFREAVHFDFLRDVAVPEWEAQAGARLADGFRAWSVACSTGEEPYSIALTLAEAGPRSAWGVTATDTSPRLLKKAAAGIFNREALENLSAEVLHKHFEPCTGPQHGSFRVRAALRNRVEFQRLSLLRGPDPRRAPFHAIFCRDVMMYFDRPTQEELFGRLLRQLAPGGYLFVGHAECLTDVRHAVRSIQPAVYRKPSDV